ncbi:MAG: phospholipase D-like domain-containing protein [Bacteriovoracia bacterium]
MKIKLSLALICLISVNSWAVKLSDYHPYKFEVLFTNPVCETYEYNRAVTTHSGKTETSKPDDVYCKPSDEEASVSRKNAPQYRLVEWITSDSTKEIDAAYLSFSSKNIVHAFCSALRKGVKVNLILDGHPETDTNKDAEGLKKCGSITVTYRGSTGGLGYAHNKILIVNPKDARETKIVFSSGNMTSGTSINHENWNFITTSPKSYFAQTHNCVISAMIEAGDTKGNFRNHLNNCRSRIKAPRESDITVYFSPVDGNEALRELTAAANHSVQIEAISHRFSGAIAKLFTKLVEQKKDIKLILDDDIYWSSVLRRDIGRNTRIEAFKIYNELINKGLITRFLQTNQNIYQLQHNKFLIFTFNRGGAVFTGAGNMTTAAFTKNFENFYYITVPEVVEAYNKQYDLYFNKMATSPEDMPRDYVLP